MTKQASHGELGDIDLLRSPINLSQYSHGSQFERAGPELGEHSVEILRELDYSGEQIEQLKKSGVVKIAAAKTEP